MNNPNALTPQELLKQLQAEVEAHPNASLLVNAPSYGTEECYILCPVASVYYEPALGFFDSGWGIETYDDVEEFQELYPDEKVPEFNEYIVIDAME